MDSIKLFISHSSKTDKNKNFLAQLCDSLDTTTIDVLVDQEMGPGKEWFRRLYDYMWECHAAVILLSEAALEDSEWVKAEAAILGARRRWNENFTLILVPLDGITLKQIEQHPFFNAIRLNDFNFVTVSQEAGQVAEVIKGLLDKYQTDATPFDTMLTLIKEILTPINKQIPAAIDRTLKKLAPNFKPRSDDPLDSLIRVLLRDPQHVFNNIRTLFIELSHLLDKDQAYKILDIVKGHWVHPNAATSLSKSRRAREAIAINGIQIFDFTGDCYARQSWPSPRPYTLVSANSDDRTFAQIESTLLSQVAKSVPERLKRQRLDKITDPLLLVFPFPDSPEADTSSAFPDEFLLEEIKTKLKNVTVILSTGQELPAQLIYVTALEPLLEQNQEDEQFLCYRDTVDYIDEKL